MLLLPGLETRAANRDGRQVMLDWMLHFCGTAQQETVEITAEATMNTTFYKGEKPRFTFILYTNIHRGCHKEINSVPLAEMDELLKMRKYLKGILEAPEMAAAVTAVKALPTINQTCTRQCHAESPGSLEHSLDNDAKAC